METILIQLTISLILSAVFAPDIDTPEAASLEEFDVPRLNQGKSLPVIFGTFLIKSANVLWYGDLKTEEVITNAGK